MRKYHYWREYKQKNNPRLRAYAKAYYQEHLEEKREYDEVYREMNLENRRAQALQYQKDHPEYVKARSARYRARKKGVEGDYTEAQWVGLCSFFDGCPCCGAKVPVFHADHIVPLTQKGATNWITNIQPLCGKCNASKRDWRTTDYRPEAVKEWAKAQTT